ncbi:MAG: DNA primase [Chloroflexi bacterium]|nr:DNA primase [Chloroflexota bacterium]
MSTVDEVKQKLDIVEVIGSYVALTKAGRTFKALCPFHSEKHGSFFVFPERQSWHCFGACNTGGDVFSFVMKKEGVTFGEALRLLAERTGVSIPTRFEPEAQNKEKERLYQVNQSAAQYFHNLLINSPVGEKVRHYLAGRGVSPDAITSFQLGYSLDSWEAIKKYLTESGYSESELLAAGLIIESETKQSHDRFRNRLMFPIVDMRGRVIGFGARALDDTPPKYLNSPQSAVFDKSANLYGINFAAQFIRQMDKAVIVEGYMDVIVAHQHDIRNVVASMGVAITEKQITTLKRLTKNVVLALDADAAGEEAMLRGVEFENALDSEIKVVILPEGKDPDDVIKENVGAWAQLVASALPVVEYTLDRAAAGLDLTTASGKSALVAKLLPIVAQIKDFARQEHYLAKLSRLTDTNRRNLETALSRIKSKGRTRGPTAEAVKKMMRPVFSNRIEEHCLALLLQHSELRSKADCLTPECFGNSENREIFVACVGADDLSSRDVDPSIREHLESLAHKELIVSSNKELETELEHCARRLRKRYLENLAQLTDLVTDADASEDDLAKLHARVKEANSQLKQVFMKKD